MLEVGEKHPTGRRSERRLVAPKPGLQVKGQEERFEPEPATMAESDDCGHRALRRCN